MTIRVLVVDDEPLVRRGVAQGVDWAALSCEVVGEAANGEEAIDKFFISQDFDVVILDIMMPETNGLDAARAIRRMDRPDAAVIPIVAMTANAFTEDVNQALEAGMNAHISKPIDVPTMMNVIGELLQRE